MLSINPFNPSFLFVGKAFAENSHPIRLQRFAARRIVILSNVFFFYLSIYFISIFNVSIYFMSILFIFVILSSSYSMKQSQYNQCCSVDFLFGHTILLNSRVCARWMTPINTSKVVYNSRTWQPCTYQLFFLPKMAHNFNGSMATLHSAGLVTLGWQTAVECGGIHWSLWSRVDKHENKQYL